MTVEIYICSVKASRLPPKDRYHLPIHYCIIVVLRLRLNKRGVGWTLYTLRLRNHQPPGDPDWNISLLRCILVGMRRPPSPSLGLRLLNLEDFFESEIS